MIPKMKSVRRPQLQQNQFLVMHNRRVLVKQIPLRNLLLVMYQRRVKLLLKQRNRLKHRL
jgi:hypothetical protein